MLCCISKLLSFAEIGCRFGANLYYRHKEIFYPVLNKKVQICTKCVCMVSILDN